MNSLPKDAFEKLPLLERLDFIETGQNIILAGNPGTGKTHIAVGLGLKACIQGYKEDDGKPWLNENTFKGLHTGI